MDDDVTTWIGQLKEGDDEAARQVWDRFFHRVQGLARRKLGEGAAREADAEDLALSAINALCVGARENRFRQLEDRDDLWQLLAMITSRKAAQAYRKRSRRAEVGESALMHPDGVGGVQEVAGASPDVLDTMAGACEHLLCKLDDRLREVALLRLQGHSNQEIADQIGRSVKSVERYLKLIRELWTRED